MSRLSPDSLFHFTPSLNNLLGILDKTFYPRYCYEKFELANLMTQSIEWVQIIDGSFPMVCFCDIPLSQLMNHIEIYGKYGLGMSKEWGIREGLNPVVYFNKNSHLIKIINKLLLLDSPELPDSPDISNAQAYSGIMRYMKPYEGTLYRGGCSVNKNVRFYDEHEWRYVPDSNILDENKIKGRIPLHIYQNQVQLAKANRKLETDKTKLSFSANDIKYIIINEESQINNMVKELRNIKGGRYDNDTIDRLISRIITVKQIENDF